MKFRKKGKFEPETTDAATGNVEASGQKSERGQWGNQAEFILSCLGYAMGLGNVWKFPYTCFSNGGGAYLIPYVIVLTFIGIPTFFLELIMGQYSGKGAVQVWCLAPFFKGVGMGSLLISAMINIFYTMLLAYCLYYFAMCFQKNLPWDTCQHWYNTPACFNQREAKPCIDVEGIWYNNTCYNVTTLEPERTEELRNLTRNLVSSSQEYFVRGVLEQTDSIDQPNGIKMELALCLLGMWILCFFCVLKGIESSGKIVYFTTTFPYVVLTILLIRGALLDGSLLGIKYYLTPDWKRLGDAKVWGDAAGQIFFALSVGAGGLLTYSSYSPFYSNIYRTALFVAIANACTDWYAGFVVFSALGYMAKSQNTEVKDVATSGSGLAFVVYPQVLATLPVPQLWSAMFFFMLILLGLDSLNAGVEALITSTVDKWTSLRPYKTVVALGWCILFYLLGLPMCTRAGFYWLDLVSYYSSGWTLVIIGIIEVVVFAWVYGAKKVMAHVKEMTGNRLYPHWWFVWTFITPLFLLAVLIFNLIYFKPLLWNKVEPPTWATALGWVMTLAPLAIIIIVGIYVTIRTFMKPDPSPVKRNAGKRFAQLFKPNSDWMPAYQAKELEEKVAKATYRSKSETDETQSQDDAASISTITGANGKINGGHNEDKARQNGNASVLHDGDVELKEKRENGHAFSGYQDNHYQHNGTSPGGNPVSYENTAYDKDL